MTELTQLDLTTATLPDLKQYLKSGWPGAKASHRLEAFARACGFRTYASIRSMIADHNSVRVAFIPSEITRHLELLSARSQSDA